MKLIIDIPEEKLDVAKRGIYGILEPAMENAIPIPDNATNGDIIKAMFPDAKINELKSTNERTKVAVEWGFESMPYYYNLFYEEWWNAPYKAESEPQERNGEE